MPSGRPPARTLLIVTMRRAIVKKVRAIVTPEAACFIAAVALTRWSELEAALLDLIVIYPYVVAITGAAFAWRFRRSRLLFALAVLAFGFHALTLGPGAPDRELLFQAAAVLVPVNLAAIAWLPERGLWSLSALRRWVAIAVQVALVVALARQESAGWLGIPETIRRALVADGPFGWAALGWPAWIAFVGSLGALAAGRIFAAGTTARGYLWALLAAFMAFGLARGTPDRILYIGTAGLILLLAVLETSYRMAYHDSLTELLGRRALNEALAILGGDYTVAIVDVDHFKKFNDRFGHDVGDQVLRMVATRLAGVGGGGRAFRYGGEEFAVLFPGKSLDDCLPVLEQLREGIAEARFTVRRRIRPRRRPKGSRGGSKRRVSITVSVGAAQRTDRQAKPDEVVRAADEALYKAKGAGRNRVRAYSAA